ncbi:MAG: hypothetical protein ACKVW3_15030 [Phycisphaerales bacterium]
MKHLADNSPLMVIVACGSAAFGQIVGDAVPLAPPHETGAEFAYYETAWASIRIIPTASWSPPIRNASPRCRA